MSVFLLLIVISCTLAKDAGKKETKETTAKPKLPQTLSRGKNKHNTHTLPHPPPKKNHKKPQQINKQM